MKQCHCTHPGCLFAWLATTSASHVATWMSLPENTGVFYLRKKLPNRTVNMSCSRRRAHSHAHTFKLWSEAHGSDKTKLLNQANLLGNSGTKRRFAVTHGNSDSSGCFTCETCKTKHPFHMFSRCKRFAHEHFRPPRKETLQFHATTWQQTKLTRTH